LPANIKEIDKRIRSVRNTQQITRAMKMVAAAKLRRTQASLVASRPYSQKLTELPAGPAGASIEHPFFDRRDVQRRMVVVITSDKGLCGSYNANLVRVAHGLLEGELKQEGVENQIYCVGRKASDYFKRRAWAVHRMVNDLGGMINVARIHEIADELMELYLNDEFQEIVLVYTHFKSTLSYIPMHSTLLPLSGEAEAKDAGEGAGGEVDYIYEPSAEVVFHTLLPKSVRNAVFHAIAEAFTSEHGARMTSMSSATDNAGDLIDKLVLFRNRARQAAITQEISEIVGGADAIA